MIGFELKTYQKVYLNRCQGKSQGSSSYNLVAGMSFQVQSAPHHQGYKEYGNQAGIAKYVYKECYWAGNPHRVYADLPKHADKQDHQSIGEVTEHENGDYKWGRNNKQNYYSQ